MEKMRLSTFSVTGWVTLVCGAAIDLATHLQPYPTASHLGFHLSFAPVSPIQRVGHLVTLAGMLGVVTGLCLERIGAWRRRLSSDRPTLATRRSHLQTLPRVRRDA